MVLHCNKEEKQGTRIVLLLFSLDFENNLTVKTSTKVKETELATASEWALCFPWPMDATKEWDCFIGRSHETSFNQGRVESPFPETWDLVGTGYDQKGTCAPVHCWIELKYNLKSVQLKHWLWHWHWVSVTEKLSAFMCSMWNCGSAQMQWLRPQPGSS